MNKHHSSIPFSPRSKAVHFDQNGHLNAVHLVSALCLIVCCSMTTKAFAEDLWVRPAGSVTCGSSCAGSSFNAAINGTANIQWGEGAGLVGAGDTLHVCGDFDRNTEKTINIIDVRQSGTADAPIVIDGNCGAINASYPNGRLWGSRRIDKGAWTDHGDGVYSIAWKYITEFAAEGAFGAEALLQTTASVDECKATNGSIYADTENRRLYYNPTKDPDTLWANWTSAIDVHGNDHIRIQNLVLRGGTSGEHGVIELTGAEGSGEAEHVSVSNSNIGFGASQLIECFDGCDHFSLDNTVLHDAPVATYLCRGKVTCANVRMANNEVYSGNDIANIFEPGRADRHALGGQSITNSIFEGNYIHDWAGDGINIWVKKAQQGRDNIIRYNRITRLYDTQNANYHRGIALNGSNEADKGDSTSGWKIHGNVISDLDGGKGEYDEGVAIRVKSAISDDGSSIEISNNTISNCHMGVWLRENPEDPTLGVAMYNNIIDVSGDADGTSSANGTFVKVDRAGGSGVVVVKSDANFFPGKGLFDYRGSVVSTLNEWQATLGGCPNGENDCSSNSEDPKLQANLSLGTDSPAANRGMDLGDEFRLVLASNTSFPSPSLDDQETQNASWDIGAHVYRPEAPIEGLSVPGQMPAIAAPTGLTATP